jgi:hypothetical protein
MLRVRAAQQQLRVKMSRAGMSAATAAFPGSRHGAVGAAVHLADCAFDRGRGTLRLRISAAQKRIAVVRRTSGVLRILIAIDRVKVPRA